MNHLKFYLGYWILAFFGLAYPVFLIFNALFVVLWLLLWKRYIFISLLAILAGWSSLLAIYPIHFSQQSGSSGLPVKLLSFNVHHFYGNQRAESIPESRSKISEFLVEQAGDIICIQEFFAIGDDFGKTLIKYMQSIHMNYYSFNNYKDFYNKQKICGIATFSRYPVVKSGYFKLQDQSILSLHPINRLQPFLL